MRCGIFGKLPAKRDFVAVGAPREFLQVWEAWMQGGLSASRQQLGAGWQEAFLRAPIWRFWLGPDLCGFPVLGAFMPSVDGVGRYFPLTIFARPDPGEELPPPEIEPHDEWFGRAEDLLLSALAEGADYSAVSAGAEALSGSAAGTPKVDTSEIIRTGGCLVGPFDPSAPARMFEAFRRLDPGPVYAAMSYWWTVGGDEYPARALSSRRMPDPYIYARMLTGRFDDGR